MTDIATLKDIDDGQILLESSAYPVIKVTDFMEEFQKNSSKA